MSQRHFKAFLGFLALIISEDEWIDLDLVYGQNHSAPKNKSEWVMHAVSLLYPGEWHENYTLQFSLAFSKSIIGVWGSQK